MNPSGHPVATRLLALLTLACLAVGWNTGAATYRIASWNLQSLAVAADSGSTLESRLNTAGFALRQLQPDVVLLQEVPDFAAATKIANAMGPGYVVRVCSAFPGAAAGQVGVISKHPSAVAWSESLLPDLESRVAGGYAFAALRLGESVVGFFSVSPSRDEAVIQPPDYLDRAMGSVLGKIQGIQGWQANRAEEFFLGISSDTISGRALYEALPGFTGAFLDQPPVARLTTRARANRPAGAHDQLFANGGGFLAAASVSRALVSDHGIVSVDWDPAAVMPADRVPADWLTPPAIAIAAVDAVPTDTAGPIATGAGELLLGVELKWWVAGLGVVVCLILLLNLMRFPGGRRRSDALALTHPDKILMLSEARGDASMSRADLERLREEVRPHFFGWLREKFISALVSKNRDLEDTQHHAADRAHELGDRLQAIQSRLEDRTRKAEHRVRELEEELNQAKSENRELIQENLFLAQRELEEARRRVEAAAKGRVS